MTVQTLISSIKTHLGGAKLIQKRIVVLSVGLLSYTVSANAQTIEAIPKTQEIKNRVYICEYNGKKALRNTPPLDTSLRQCQAKTLITLVAVPTVVPNVPKSVGYPMNSSRAFNDPQPAANALVLGARIPTSVQTQRDVGRQRILLSELQAAEQRLAELNSEYRGGQPDRLGSEKNYQKYLDRTSDLKKHIQLTEATIASLRRELSAMGNR